MAEWQTQRTQNPSPSKACGFKSHLRHYKNPVDHGSAGFLFSYAITRHNQTSVVIPLHRFSVRVLGVVIYKIIKQQRDLLVHILGSELTGSYIVVSASAVLEHQ